MKKIILSLSFLLIAACGGGSSSSGGVEESAPGQNLPANFVGTYLGMLRVTAEAAGVSESDSFEITITVFANGTVRFDGDDPDETFTVGIADDGSFSGNVDIDEDECSGSIGVTGSVDGTTASGTVEGDGECEISGITVSVELRGDFTATK